MRQLVRLACAGIAVITIAALTSVGLFAIVAGGLPFTTPAARTSSGGVPFLVTIQAAQGTPTPSTSTAPTAPASSTQTPWSLFSALAPATTAGPDATTGVSRAGSEVAESSASAAPTPPGETSVSPPTGAAGPSSGPMVGPGAPPTPGSGLTAGAASTPAADSAPAPSDSSRASAGSNSHVQGESARHGEPDRQAAHDGVTLEISQVERGWQAVGPDGAAQRPRDGFELVTLQVRLANGAGEVRYVADADIVLVGEDGSRMAPRKAAPLRDPHLLTVPLPAGDVIRGWLSYEVPTGLPIPRLQWSPTRPDRPRAEATYLLTLPQ